MMAYNPKIDQSLIKRLYALKHSRKEKIPITKIVSEAIKEYLEKAEGKSNPS